VRPGALTAPYPAPDVAVFFLRPGPTQPSPGSTRVDEHANIRSVTSEGSPYARFRRALETGNEMLVLGAARELPQIALDDALRICLVLRDGDPEARAATIPDLRVAAAALEALPTRTAEAMEQLQRICVARGIG
jgi:hypothetical protein